MLTMPPGGPLPEDIAAALAARPGQVASAGPLDGGWNSSDWLVVPPGGSG